MIILAVQDVRKSFGTHEVLKSVSFTLQERERMGLVGVNGCGKSTLMKIIAGLETADSGTVSIQKGLNIGYLAQQGDFQPGETVREALERVFEPLVREGIRPGTDMRLTVALRDEVGEVYCIREKTEI